MKFPVRPGDRDTGSWLGPCRTGEVIQLEVKAVDKFILLTVTSERTIANRTCAALEDAGIPVMIEHEVVSQECDEGAGFRVLVPSQFTQAAMKLTGAAVSPLFMKTSERVQ